MNTPKSPLVKIVAMFGILPMATYATIQFTLLVLGLPLFKIGGQDWDYLDAVARTLPWIMIVFAYPFAYWTEPSRARRWFSFIVLVGLNIVFYLLLFSGFSFLTSQGEDLIWAIISLIDFVTTALFVFKQ